MPTRSGCRLAGLRSVRYWKEVPGIKSIVANDIETAAVKNIRRNVHFNGISDTQIIPNQGDARAVMYQNQKAYDVIDLDPYGSGAEFFDAAVQSINDGGAALDAAHMDLRRITSTKILSPCSFAGLICVTCTDMQVLCGNYPEVCSYKDGALPLKGTQAGP
jgi:tRNA (guanine26-N2/guanine27-N2)-dimethyltransferase